MEKYSKIKQMSAKLTKMSHSTEMKFSKLPSRWDKIISNGNYAVHETLIKRTELSVDPNLLSLTDAGQVGGTGNAQLNKIIRQIYKDNNLSSSIICMYRRNYSR